MLHDVRIALDRCVDLAQLEVEVRRLWPQILAVKATAEVTADVKARKFKMAKAAFMAAPTVDELNAQWSLSAPKFERVPDDFEALSVVYHQRHADIGNGVGPAIAAEDDIPF